MKTAIGKVTIEGRDYVPADAVKEYDGAIKIVILQRGWIMIGKYERNGSDCKLHNASVIRKWGTTKGIGELANNGKQSDTVLDKCHGVVEFDYLTVVACIACKEDVWESVL
jgi:hypothetical protein